MASESKDYQPLAGGQSLLPMMHLRLAQPEILLDLNNVQELDFITDKGTHIEIGAMVRYAALADSSVIRDKVPLFAQALPHIAHQAIRNRGTIGGSAALADPAAEMPALLKALNATIVAVSKFGKREIAADDFFLGIYDTALEENELVHSVSIPAVTANQCFGFYELARRHGDYAMAGVAISAQSVQPYKGLRIVFFSISDHAVRAFDAEAILEDCSNDDHEALQRATDALSSLDFYEDLNASVQTKAHLAKVVMKRALNSMALERS